ncbi:MAG: cupin domain-containing protein [Actinomycetota bacterium]|nr:cupin domain-containing protein [Actinomycetota bacterium]
MSLYEESQAARSTRAGGTFYANDLVLAREQMRGLNEAPHVIRAEDQLWEDSPHGRIKWIAHPGLSANVTDIEAYIQELSPDGRSGKHRHMAEEFVFILEGRGYSLHWDVEALIGDDYEWRVADTPQRFEWKAGDWMYVPVNTVHQHFNSDGEEPVRFISATSLIFKYLMWHDLEQLEAAPEWQQP